MAQYIKKVGVTPTRGNGFIIDSLNTNDNPHFNAPSLNVMKDAIEGLADNNLLFEGALLALKNAPYGWYAQGGEGSEEPEFHENEGYRIYWNSKALIRVCNFLPNSYNLEELLADEEFSVSVMYKGGQDNYGIHTASLEHLKYLVEPTENLVDEDGILISLTSGIQNQLGFYIENNAEDYALSILAIKIEKRGTATPIDIMNSGVGLSYELNALESMIMTQRFRIRDLNVPASGLSGDINVDQSGYKAIAIIGVEAPANISFRSCKVRFTHGYEDNMVDYFLNNMSGADMERVQIFVDVLFIRNSFTSGIRTEIIDR